MEGAWKNLEFTVNMYKEQKDIFILGGMDDVLAVLEETQVHNPTLTLTPTNPSPNPNQPQP